MVSWLHTDWDKTMEEVEVGIGGDRDGEGGRMDQTVTWIHTDYDKTMMGWEKVGWWRARGSKRGEFRGL